MITRGVGVGVGVNVGVGVDVGVDVGVPVGGGVPVLVGRTVGVAVCSAGNGRVGDAVGTGLDSEPSFLPIRNEPRLTRATATAMATAMAIKVFCLLKLDSFVSKQYADKCGLVSVQMACLG
jgi:hypothetical protein